MRDRRQHFSFSCLSYSLLLCALFTFPHTHWYAHPVSLWCFIQGQLNISLSFPCPRRLWFCFVFITWYSKGDRDSLMGLLILGWMPDATSVCHFFSLLFMWEYYLLISQTWEVVYIVVSAFWMNVMVTASYWISSHMHVLLHSTRCMFAYVMHALLKDSWLSHVFHTWIYRRIYGIRLATVRILTNENSRPWN